MMALDYSTIKYKPRVQRELPDGTKEYVQDLLAKTWTEWRGPSFINPIIINEHYIARPDLVSLAVYGSDEYGDLICKFNGISNPFELNEGMVIQLPPVTWLQESTEKREYTPCELLSGDKSIQPAKETKAQRDQARSSSASTVGDEPPFIIDRTMGIVIY